VTFDVIVIGAGVAGLTVARELSGAGRRILLLEGRDRIGGRILTHHFPDIAVPIELGAEFIHGEAEETFHIVRAAGLAAAELPDNHWWSRGGRWQLLDFWPRIERLQKAAASIRGRDRSFAEFLRGQRGQSALDRQLARGFVEGYHAAHADRMSTKALASADGEQEQPDGNRQFRIIDGQDALVAWLRAGIDPERAQIVLGAAAVAVSWNSSGVEVVTRGASGHSERTFRARSAVITIPIGVWKAAREQPGAIRFDPPLREKMKALARIEPGHVVKVVLRFGDAFWEEGGFVEERSARSVRGGRPLNFVHSADPFVPTWWTQAPIRAPLLTAWAGGHAADALLAEGADALVGRVLDSLSRTFAVPRRKLETSLAGTWWHDWQSDPFSRGAYSYAAVGGANAAQALARPERKTLFFAGEATSSDQTGTVAGAIASGKRAAREVLDRHS
jgi:monoamine oxidase